MKFLSPVILLMLLIPATVSAQSFEVESTTNEALGGAVILSQPRPADCLTVLSCSAPEGLSFQVDYLQQYEMKEFTTYAAAVEYRRSRLVAAFGVSQFGRSDLFIDQTLRGMLGWAGRSLAVGIILSGRRLEFGGGYGSLRAAAAGVGCSYRFGSCFVGMTADNLNRPVFVDTSPAEPRRLSLFAEYARPGDFQIVARLISEEDQETRIAVGQQIALSSKARILWGVHSAPFEYGGALQLTAGGFELTFAVNYHPVLGFTTGGGLMTKIGSSREE
ncbi:MAG TPA: hypothetical protein PLF13_09020 [candidate division Zixibacteria bacterium]|nr:hypothetical protein [candidate division Zixibacteria bacterium]